MQKERKSKQTIEQIEEKKDVKKKISSAELEKEWIDAIEGASKELQISLPRYVKCTREQQWKFPQAYFFELVDGVATEVSAHEMASGIHRVASMVIGKYRLTFKQALMVQQAWETFAQEIPWPKPILWRDEKGIAFQRLPFNPNPAVTIDTLAEKAPLFWGVLQRMENHLAFAQRLGSLLDPEADRKQAVWVWGEQDAGKSTIQSMLHELIPNFSIMSTEGRRSGHWKTSLVGARLLTESEADPEFLKTSEFKALTGEDEFEVNPKFVRPHKVRLDAILFLFSNDAPEIENSGPMRNRVIPCFISRLDPGVRLGRKETRRKLQAEREFILQYCWNVYKAMRGTTIEFDSTRLDAVIEAGEQSWLDIFDRFFVVNPLGFVTAADFGRVCSIVRLSAAEKKVLRRYLVSAYGITYQYTLKRADGRVFKVLEGISLVNADISQL